MPNLVIADNHTKQALRAGKVVVGTMLAEIRQPSIMQLLVNAGFDYVIIDNEHGAFSSESIADLSRMARILGLTPIVRVPDLAYPYLAQSLDGGAQGIMLPRVTSVDQVHAALEMVKYPPVGRRGCAFGRGHTDFKAGPLVENMTQANDATMVIIQVETAEALDQAAAIAAIPGVDALFIGPTDLSIALGVPGQPASPQVVEAVAHVQAACQPYDVAVAIQANDLAYATRWVEAGLQMISYASEAALLVAAASAAISAIHVVKPGV